MKKIFMTGFFLLLGHNICMASGSDKSESEFDLSKNHKTTLETGDIIYSYQSMEECVEEFKREQVTNLLADRLDILCNLMKSYNQNVVKDLDFYKGNLDINDIILINSATQEESAKIFGNYNSQNINIDYIIQVGAYLKTRIVKEDALSNLSGLISCCETLKQRGHVNVYKFQSHVAPVEEFLKGLRKFAC